MKGVILKSLGDGLGMSVGLGNNSYINLRGKQLAESLLI
jgi:hypothetical protein